MYHVDELLTNIYFIMLNVKKYFLMVKNYSISGTFLFIWIDNFDPHLVVKSKDMRAISKFNPWYLLIRAYVSIYLNYLAYYG